MPTNIILMISDGLGFNGWLAADYYRHGAAGRQIYQRPRPDGRQWQHFGMAHWALNFIDRRGRPIRYDGSALPPGAVDWRRQSYDPERRWRRFENALDNDFLTRPQLYTSYTDSAASATALMSGRTTTVARLNMNWNATERYQTIGELAAQQGLACGVVTSVQTCHATPAGAFAHHRYREHYPEIFRELLASDVDVLLGAGHPDYDDAGRRRARPVYDYVGGESCWRELRSRDGRDGFRLLDDAAEFAALAAGRMTPPRRLLGIARAATTLHAQRPRGAPRSPAVPELATLTRAALQTLARREAGYFLLVEAGAVDWMNHNNDLPRMFEEQDAFNRAVETVVDWVERRGGGWDDTLLIVTADHECGGLWGDGSYHSALPDGRFDPRHSEFIAFNTPRNRGRGVAPVCQYATGHHSNDLVPLWAIGRRAADFNDDTRYDPRAAELWGDAFGWDGRFVHNTDVFRVMRETLPDRHDAGTVRAARAASAR